MMMRAISEASDLTPYIDMDIEERIRSREADPTYNPNPNGYYQSGIIDLTDLPDDTLVKVSVYSFASVKLRLPDDVRIVRMTRDEHERTTSFARSFGAPEPQWQIEAYERGEDAIAAELVVDYESVMGQPLALFDFLAGMGWPIDAQVAATFIDPSLHRNK